MAISSGQYTVSTEPVQIHTADEDGVLVIVNTSHNICIGNANVTTSTGYIHLSTNPPLVLDLGPGEVLYAVRYGGTDALVTTLRTKNQ